MRRTRLVMPGQKRAFALDVPGIHVLLFADVVGKGALFAPCPPSGRAALIMVSTAQVRLCLPYGPFSLRPGQIVF
jgi:hypothetical protein